MGGECYVPIISDVVKFTPLKKWFKGGIRWEVQEKPTINQTNIIKYAKYLGEKHDLVFQVGSINQLCSRIKRE